MRACHETKANEATHLFQAYRVVIPKASLCLSIDQRTWLAMPWLVTCSLIDLPSIILILTTTFGRASCTASKTSGRLKNDLKQARVQEGALSKAQQILRLPGNNISHLCL
jgi:hypothetical protein